MSAQYIKREGNLNGKPTTSISDFHHDHLGSIAAISNELGQITERLAYDPWGRRRMVNGQTDVNDTLYGVNTDRGYALREHLDEMGIVHMNGRIYECGRCSEAGAQLGNACARIDDVDAFMVVQWRQVLAIT